MTPTSTDTNQLTEICERLRLLRDRHDYRDTVTFHDHAEADIAYLLTIAEAATKVVTADVMDAIETNLELLNLNAMVAVSETREKAIVELARALGRETP